MTAQKITRVWTQKPPEEKGVVPFIAREGLPIWRAILQQVNELITGGTGLRFDVTPVKTANYSAAINELVRADPTMGPFTITLPSSTADTAGRAVAIQVESAVNAVTVTNGTIAIILPLSIASYIFLIDGA